MKANKLIIGDWVLINGTPRRVQAVDGVDDEIMADYELYTLAEDRYHSEDKVDGVPLTPEILEKNFPTAEELAWWPVEDGLHCESRNTEDIMVSGVFRFVHQLQNALRLCGIEKEITI